jgi:tetratricopeptide (TPR) repeat protein
MLHSQCGFPAVAHGFRKFVMLATAFIGLCALLPGCDENEFDAPTATPQQSDATPIDKPRENASAETSSGIIESGLATSASPISETECAELAEQFVATMSKASHRDWSNLLDHEEVVRRATHDLDLAIREREAIARAISGEAAQRGRLLDQVGDRRAGGEMKYLRTIDRDGRKSIILRHVNPANELDYFEIPVQRNAAGKLLAADIRKFSGTTASEHMRYYLLWGLPTESGQTIKKTDGQIPIRRPDLENMMAFLQASDEHRHTDILQIARRFDASIARSKLVLGLRLRSARLISQHEYSDAIRAYREALPNDAFLYLVAADEHTLRGGAVHAMQCIDRLDAMIGGDPYLHAIRAKIHLHTNDFADAKKAANAAIAGGDRRVDPLWTLLTVSLREQDHAESLRLLKKMVFEHKIVLDKIATNPDYAAFLRSPQAAEWQKFSGVQTRPSDEEALAFALKFAQAINAGDVDAANAMVDWYDLIHFAFANFDMPKDERRTLSAVMLRNLQAPDELIGGVSAAVKSGATYEFLRILDRNGRQVALFRLSTPATRNYHEFSLARQGDGSVLADDLFIYLTSDQFSQSLRRNALAHLANAGLVTPDKFDAADRPLAQSAATILALEKATNANQHTAVLRLIASLPPQLQRERFVVNWQLNSGINADKNAADLALRIIEQHYSQDPRTRFMLAQVYMLNKDYAKAIAATERLYEAVGGDPELHTDRAAVYLLANDLPAARAAIQRAVEEGDARPTPYYLLLEAAVKEKRYDQAVKILIVLLDRFELVIEAEILDEFQDFAKSPEYAKYKELVKERQAERSQPQ